MGNITLDKFYPANNVVDATAVNNNYNAIAGSTGGINDENVANEGLIKEHFLFQPHIKYADWQSNEYYKSTGTAVASDAQYRSLTDVFIATANKTNDVDKRHEINHGSNGVATTTMFNGTKIGVGGLKGTQQSNGVSLEVGDVIHVFWNLTAWRFEPDNGTYTNYVCELIDSTSTRSSILNYAFCAYPRFNCVDDLGSNLNFHRADDATYGFTTEGFRDPADGVAALGGGGGVSNPNTTGLNNLWPFHDRRTDHWTWIPIMMGSGGSSTGAANNTVAVMYDTENGASNTALGEAKLVSGQTYIKVTTPQTLYAIQMYLTGCISTHYDTNPGSPSEDMNCAFIEDQAVTNAQGGIDGKLHLERCSIGYVIYRKESV